jgi:hypothetical protein
MHLPILLIVLLLLAAAMAFGLLFVRRVKQLRPHEESASRQATVPGDQADDIHDETPSLSQSDDTQQSTVAPATDPDRADKGTDEGSQEIAQPQVEQGQSGSGEGSDSAAEQVTGNLVSVELETADVTTPDQPSSLPPVKRGGHPLGIGAARKSDEKPREATAARPPRPELVCWKAARKWHVGLEIPSEYLTAGGVEVRHGEALLDVNSEGRAEAHSFPDAICLVWSGSEESVRTTCDNQYMLMRLIGENMDRGRLVRRATSGEFLVIVPETWRRDESVSGSPNVAPDPVALCGYMAHFFTLSNDPASRIGFRDSAGNAVAVELGTTCFCLIGTRVADACEHAGPLFVEDPPLIKSLSTGGWSGISTVVVGQEGGGRGRWKTFFSPTPGTDEQELPAEIRTRHSGWYSIRIYSGDNGPPVDCLDFRFADGFKCLSIRTSVLPGPDGHCHARVDFEHRKACDIRPNPSSESLLTECEEGRTVVSIPPEPAFDRTSWRVRPEGGFQAVDFVLLLERIWWAITSDSTTRTPWTDRPVELSRDFVRATSRHSVRVRLPRPRWTREVRVGFAPEWSRARAYRVPVRDQEVAIPLSDLEGSKELTDETQACRLRLWAGGENDSGTPIEIAVFPAASSPKPKPGSSKPHSNASRRRVRAEARRTRRYLTRLSRSTQDAALCELILTCRATWTAGSQECGLPRRTKTACVVHLAWEHLSMATGPHRRRKRWLRKLFTHWSADCEESKSVRTDYGNSKPEEKSTCDTSKEADQ